MSWSARGAIGFAVLLTALQVIRGDCFGWPHWGASLPFELDGYVAAALLVAGGLVARRWPLFLAAAWGFMVGIMYRTFFQQLGDPARRVGAELLVLEVKGVLFALALAGFVSALRPKPAVEVGQR